MTQFAAGSETINRTRILSAGLASSGNITTETLSGGAEYTGTWERPAAPDAQLWVQTEGAATLFIEFSPDGGTTVDQFPFGGLTLTAGIPYYDHVVVGGQYFRIRVVDTSGSDNDIKTLVYYGSYQRPASTISSGMNLNQQAINTKAVVFGIDADGTYQEVGTTPGGQILTSDSNIEATLGRISDRTIDTKYGSVQSIDAADSAVDFWAFATDTASPRANTKTFQTVASTIYVVSSSTSDTSVTLTVHYIDADGAAQVVTGVALNGRTGVSIGATGLDSARAFVDNGTAPVGNIYIMAGNDISASGTPNDVTDVMGMIPAGDNQTQQGHLTVPSGKTLIMTDDNFSISLSRASGAAGSGDVTLRIKEPGKVSRVIRRFFPTTANSVSKGVAYITATAASQIVWRLDDVSDTDTNAHVTWSYVLVDA